MSALLPYFIALLAISVYASLAPIAKKMQLNIPHFAFIGITMGIMCVLASVISFFFEKDFSLAKIPPRILAGLGLFSCINLIGFVFYLTALSKLPITHYQLIGLMTPIVGGILAYMILGEALKLQYLYGLIIIGFGLFVALRGGAS